MLEVRTTFTPFKARISRREPVSLSIEVVNGGQEPEIASFELELGGQFSLEKTGYKSEAMEKIGELKPGENKKYYYDIWPK